MEHPQKFELTGRQIAGRWWWGKALCVAGIDYEPIDPPRVVDHLPPRDATSSGWLYRVIGQGLDYLECEQCLPGGSRFVDNRPTSGA